MTNFINKTPIEVVQAINGITRHTSVVLIGYACLGNEYLVDTNIPAAIHYLSTQVVSRHREADAALARWREILHLPQLTNEERWLFEHEQPPLLPDNFPIETLALLVNTRHTELIPQLEMVSQTLLNPSLSPHDKCEQFAQLHRSCLKLMTFSKWIADYVCRLVKPENVNADNILSPDHAPDVMLFHVMRECRSPMTALIGYTDMLLSLHSFTDEQRASIVEKINRCCQTIHERSRDMTQFIEMWLEETNRDSVTHQSDLVFGEVLRSPQFYAELINCTYLAFMPDIEELTTMLQDDAHNTLMLRQIFDYAQYVNCILRHSYDFFR